MMRRRKLPGKSGATEPEPSVVVANAARNPKSISKAAVMGAVPVNECLRHCNPTIRRTNAALELE